MGTTQLIFVRLSGLSRKLLTTSLAIEYSKITIGIFLFYVLLIFPPPSFITELLVNANSIIVVFFLVAFFALLMCKNGSGWEAIQAAFIFGLFATTLINKWQMTPTSGEMIGGLLPWSDASDYNLEAHRLAMGELLSTWGGRRPLFSGFLAVLLHLTRDFIITLSMMTLINTVAVFIMIQMLKRLYGSLSTAVFFVLSLEFYKRFSGITLSEQLGFAVGNLALFFLLAGASSRSLSRALLGLGLLTLALNARAGAFFILPILSLWLAYSFRHTITFWRSLILASSVVLLVFLLNLYMVRVLAEPKSTSFSNYSYTLYGLASGNKGWTQVVKDHPDVIESEVYPLAIQKIRSDPFLFFKGVLGSFGDYFKPTYGAFNFIYRGWFEQLIHLILWGMVMSGLVYSISRWKDGLQGLTLASFLGVILSVPLLPPVDSDGMRVYAATIPFSTLWMAHGISVLSMWRRTVTVDEINTKSEARFHFQQPALLLSIILIFLVVPAPLFLKVFMSKSPPSNSFSSPVCKPGEHALAGMKFQNEGIFIINDTAATESYMPFIRVSDFKNAAIKNNASSILDSELLQLNAGEQISFGLGMKPSEPSEGLWLISSFPLMDNFHLCGLPTAMKEPQAHNNIYYLKGEFRPEANLTVSQEYTIVTRLIRLILGTAAVFISFLLVIGLMRDLNHAIRQR